MLKFWFDFIYSLFSFIFSFIFIFFPFSDDLEILGKSTIPSIVKKNREKVEKEILQRRKRGKKEERKQINKIKFVLTNLLLIE
jgi:hypothetical protein